MATFTERFKKFVLKVLKVNEWAKDYSINREFTFQGNAVKNSLWYDGDAYELAQFYQQTGNNTNSFWGSTETKGQEIRRIHTGLPALIVDQLVNITAKDIDGINFESEANKEVWEEIEKDSDFKDKIAELTRTALVIGDGAVKFTYDLDISKTPKMEIIGGDRVDFINQRGNLKEVKFYTYYNVRGNDYTLEETYGYGYIKYKLFKGDNECDINNIPQTAGLEDVEFDSSIMLAVPFKFFNSTKYKERGKSIYEGKTDAFDAVDECVSQWVDALRAGRVKTYIPDSLIPRNVEGGFLLQPNSFDNRFIKVGSDMTEGAKNQITTEQPDIKTEAYLQTYITVLDIALQGVMSPSTLGIDNKKLDNAEAQREKEKCTLYTRNAIIDCLECIIKNIVQATFDTMAVMYNTTKVDVEADVQFGEYASPSFEAVIEVMSNPNTPMSIEAKVEEIWGDSKSEEWKAEEVKRIKNERGIVELDEPAIGSLLE